MIIAFETILAHMVRLTVALQATARVVMVVHMNDNQLLLFLGVRAECYSFMATTCVNTDQLVLW